MLSIPGPRPAAVTEPGAVAPDPRLALIGAAIDELAQEARANQADSGADGLTQRLASVWAMMADLDPALAQRLPRYTAAD
jgi:hypothetical protein